MDPRDEESPEAVPACPAWCVTTSEEHATDEPGSWLHEGPAFGMVRTWWLEGPDAFSATVTESLEGDLTSDDLRQLASDALDAAMWMDRQASSPPAPPGVSVVDLVRQAHQRSSRSA